MSMMTRRMRVGWKLASLSPHVASVRYRAMLPVLQLEKHGVEAHIFSKVDSTSLDDLHCLVIVKSFTSDDLFLALDAQRRGIPVIVDLCDNIFIDGYGPRLAGHSSAAAFHFDQIACIASTIVVTTRPLADFVRMRVRETCEVVLIPDGIETEAHLLRMKSLLRAAADAEQGRFVQGIKRIILGLNRTHDIFRSAELGSIPGHLARHAFHLVRSRYRRWSGARLLACSFVQAGPLSRAAPQATVNADSHGAFGRDPARILWFGHHGAKYAQFGMLDLLLIQRDLEELARAFDIELVVVSNCREKYEAHIKPLALRSRYVEWSGPAVLSELARARVTIIPNSLDAFSICKSPNRAVLSLFHGVPVVATRTPALDELAGCILFDDFVGSLRSYLGDSKRAVADVQRARERIEALYGEQLVGARWLALIQTVQPQLRCAVGKAQIAVVIQMPLDWPLLRPFVLAAIGRGKALLAILDQGMQDGHALISAELMGLGVELMPVTLHAVRRFVFPQTIKALLSASESSLLPHRFSHVLAKRATAQGIFAATLQHGYETPGLTYHDTRQSARKIFFSSQRIYIWGHTTELCPEVRPSTAAKCFAVGCPDLLVNVDSASRPTTEHSGMVVGVFENLHWHRYSRAYRRFFVDGLIALAETFPDVQFHLRTHPAGRWLNQADARTFAAVGNISLQAIADATQAGDGMRQLFPTLDGVICTPSSVAVHAARYGLPVAIVVENMKLGRYRPLFGISSMDDWFHYIEQLRNAATLCALRRRSQRFIDGAIHPGDAVGRVLDELCLKVEALA